MKKTLFLFLVISCALSGQLEAHDFISVVEGQPLCFSITDTVRHTACVTYQGNAVDASQAKPYKGVVTIPVRVTVKGVVYRITAIGPKAFCNSPELTGVVIPGGVTEIGSFAFDGCSKLESVVFPGNEVTIGEGAFFRCPSISRVTLGSDWTSVNLKVFSWSEKLEQITIPAKVRQIRNLKSLLSLKHINVDANNPYYNSVDGLLYSADGKTLLAAPRAIDGRVTVQEGTESILKGALADCYSVKEVELPGSVSGMSYREFAQLSELESVIFHSLEPLMTATLNGNQVFALMVAPKVKVIVPKKAQKAYKSAVVSTRGEYAELQSNLPPGSDTSIGTIPLIVREVDLLQAASINGDKKLNPKSI